MIVNEIFYSLQGEGFLAGVPSVFVRLAGCPLRCKWCDTKYAWSETAGRQYSIAEIIHQVQQWPCKNIVITGGEPMVNPDLPELVRQIKAMGAHITIETAGIEYVPDLPCDLMSISPKLSNSMEEVRGQEEEGSGKEIVGWGLPHQYSILSDQDDGLKPILQLIDNYDYQLKFVVDCESDLPEIQQVLTKLKNVDLRKVMLMPQACTRDELIQKSLMVADLCKSTGFTFCQRLHILLWDNQKGR
jgi:7-carboxy-7-deazaguanine synthase